jgi:hypothetical protein
MANCLKSKKVLKQPARDAEGIYKGWIRARISAAESTENLALFGHGLAQRTK